MRARRRGGTLDVVEDLTRAFRDLGLRIEQGREPISGTLSLPDGRSVSFEGYMQLVALLEDARERAGDCVDQPPATGRPGTR